MHRFHENLCWISDKATDVSSVHRLLRPAERFNRDYFFIPRDQTTTLVFDV